MAETRSHKADFLRIEVRPWVLVAAAGGVASIATVLGFCGRFWWAYDLFSHFRVQYFIGLCVVSTVLLVLRRRKAAACFAGFAVINFASIVPFYLGRIPPPDPRTAKLRVMLLNVNTRTGNSTLVAKTLRETDPQIVILEEIDSRWLVELADALQSYPHSCVRARSDNFGIGLFSKLPLADSAITDIGDTGVPSIVANVRVGAKSLKLIATHPLPPTGKANSRWRDCHLAKIPEHVPHDGSPAVLLGDLNVSPWSHHFKRLLMRSGLQDSSKGRGVQPTWPVDSSLMLIPLDHCLHSPEVIVTDRRIGPNVGSDHYPLIVDLAL